MVEDRLDKLCSHLTAQEFERGQIIQDAYEKPKGIWFVLRGCLKVYLNNGNKAPLLVAEISEGQSCGDSEMNYVVTE